jgi:hypothetical protein
MNICSGFLALLPRRLRQGLGILHLAKPLWEPRLRVTTFLEWMKILGVLPNLRKGDPPSPDH